MVRGARHRTSEGLRILLLRRHRNRQWRHTRRSPTLRYHGQSPAFLVCEDSFGRGRRARRLKPEQSRHCSDVMEPASSTRSDLLPDLAPTALLPAHYTERAQLVTWLKRIDQLHVRETVRREGSKFYVVEVYMKLSQSRIPSHRGQGRHPPHGRNQAPEIIVERRFSEFSQLLTEFYYLAHDGHGFIPCRFCMGFVDYVLVGKATPSLVHKWFSSESSRCELLTQFMNEMLELSRQVKTYGGECNCPGKKYGPDLMKSFLTSGGFRGVASARSEEGQVRV